MTEVSAEHLRERLVALCTGGNGGWPRKIKDRHVLLAAASRSFQRGMIHTEKEINEILRHWLDHGCPSLLIDEITLRREMVDENYLMRDDAGHFYAVGHGPAAISFAADVASVDPFLVVAQAQELRAARKRAYET